jgi:hypothetical protein
MLAIAASPSLSAAEAPPASALSKAVEGAAAVNLITPIFSQLLMMSYPKSFTPVLDQSNGASYLLELVPEGQSRQAWSEMITLSGAKGVAEIPAVTPDALAEKIAAGFRKDCPDSYAAAALGSIKLSGHDAYAALISCGTALPTGTAYSESTLFIIIKGAKDLYTIQWAERGPASKTPMVFDQAKWVGRLKRLSPIKLCQRVEGEAPPYPSCMAQK